jgi:hypothetical protein
MKQALILAGLLIISSSCFAIEYYAEYSFSEASEINEDEIHGITSWKYSFVLHWTKADIQARIDRYKESGFGGKLGDYMSQMLRARADKRIFIIDTASGPHGGWGGLFIKINENEYVVFFTGQ